MKKVTTITMTAPELHKIIRDVTACTKDQCMRIAAAEQKKGAANTIENSINKGVSTDRITEGFFDDVITQATEENTEKQP